MAHTFGTRIIMTRGTVRLKKGLTSLCLLCSWTRTVKKWNSVVPDPGLCQENLDLTKERDSDQVRLCAARTGSAFQSLPDAMEDSIAGNPSSQVGQDDVTLPGALHTPIPPSDAPVQLEWNQDLQEHSWHSYPALQEECSDL